MKAFNVGSLKTSVPSKFEFEKTPLRSKIDKSITCSPIMVQTCKSPPLNGRKTPKGRF